MTKIPLPCLCLIGNIQIFGNELQNNILSKSIEAGVNMVQLRDKEASNLDFLKTATAIKLLTQSKTLFFINDRLDIAKICEADGVQLGEKSVSVAMVHNMTENMIIGRSVHDINGAIQAEEHGADFLIVGTIFPSRSHPNLAVKGLTLLKELAEIINIPFLAIGGISKDNVESVIEAGASGVAVISAISLANSPTEATIDLLEKIKLAWLSKQSASDNTVL